MAKIASVTFSPKRANIGGAQIPALAFKAWCDILGVECCAIGISADDINIDITNYHTILHPAQVEFLNGFDAIFFQTPTINCEFDISQIKKPFVLMIHDENDMALYGIDNINSYVKHEMCRGLVHIDLDGDYYKDLHKKRMYWHPCGMPDDLYKTVVKPRTSHGILYAARVSSWKNPVLFASVAAKNKDLFNNSAYMFGNVHNGILASKILSTAETNVEISFGYFDKKKAYKTDTGLFWDVCGTSDNKMVIKRMNLAAFEAVNNGFMPIVNPNAIPKQLRGIFIEVNSMNFSTSDFRRQVSHYFDNRSLYWQQINKTMANSYASYNSIKFRVLNILDTLI